MEMDEPPGRGEFELTLFGPGYGESIILHVGDGVWVLVDSCVGTDGVPRALEYLESIGISARHAVELIVATHWHDDHIKGMARLVEVCDRAVFCCAGALCRREFLTVIGAMESRQFSVGGSGLHELYQVFSRLAQTATKTTFALANRRILVHGRCEIWSLSPDDSAFLRFLASIGGRLPGEGRPKKRIPTLSPNEVAVALWVGVGDVAVLLGSDLERRGWLDVLKIPGGAFSMASAFKVPHHGAESAHEPGVWKHMLDDDPFAVLTPWQRGGHTLPGQLDTQRILSFTTNAYSTAQRLPAGGTHRPSGIDRTLRESGIKVRQLATSPGAVRLRRRIASTAPWQVEKFGSACHLEDFGRT